MALNPLLRLCAGVLLVSLGPASLWAQTPAGHPLYNGSMPPGMIGALQHKRGLPLAGYFQPVEILAPEGVEIGLAAEGQFTQPRPAPVIVGMHIAPVYRLRVTNIPNEQGGEVYPTIEVIDRLYPPAGQEARFPIPIELTHEDLRLALQGNFITRVIYLEDPENALAIGEQPGHPSWFDAGPGSDPLLQADRLGRPVAILRMGARVPDLSAGPDGSFMGSCAPWILYGKKPSDPNATPEMVAPPMPGNAQNMPTVAPPAPPSAAASGNPMFVLPPAGPTSRNPLRGEATR